MRKTKLALKGIIGGASVGLVLIIFIKIAGATFLPFLEDSQYLPSLKNFTDSAAPFFTPFWTDNQTPTPQEQPQPPFPSTDPDPPFSNDPYEQNVMQAIIDFMKAVFEIDIGDNNPDLKYNQKYNYYWYYAKNVVGKNNFYVLKYDPKTHQITYLAGRMEEQQQQQQSEKRMQLLNITRGTYQLLPISNLNGKAPHNKVYKNNDNSAWYLAGEVNDNEPITGLDPNKLDTYDYRLKAVINYEYHYDKNELKGSPYEKKWTYYDRKTKKTYLVKTGQLIRDESGWIYFYGGYKDRDGKRKGVARWREGDGWEIFESATFEEEIGENEVGIEPHKDKSSIILTTEQLVNFINKLFEAKQLGENKKNIVNLLTLLADPTKAKINSIDTTKIEIQLGRNMNKSDSKKIEAIFTFEKNDNEYVLKTYKYFLKNNEGEIISVTFWDNDKQFIIQQETLRQFNLTDFFNKIGSELVINDFNSLNLAEIGLENLRYAFGQQRLIINNKDGHSLFLDLNSKQSGLKYAGIVKKEGSKTFLFIYDSMKQKLVVKRIEVSGESH
ncbi:MAG: hypothetical protein NC834_01455, partial [Candidatus Omnitrophica bacterium]|nr:hypothetical protein [Candidatus Omnitrophota bacterium]